MAKLDKKIKKAEFDLEDFLDQLQQMKKMGSITDLLGMIPGMNKKALAGANVDDRELLRLEAIIQSMTAKERINPKIINGSRRKRIAAGSGTRVQDVNKLLKQFEQTRKMMKQFSKMQKGGRKGGKNKIPFF